MCGYLVDVCAARLDGWMDWWMDVSLGVCHVCLLCYLSVLLYVPVLVRCICVRVCVCAG